MNGGGGGGGRRCPRKGERVSVLWLKPGSTIACTWQAATVCRARPSRGLFVAEWPAVGQGEGDVTRHTFNIDGRDWRAQS